jgi:hypothetical protein
MTIILESILFLAKTIGKYCFYLAYVIPFKDYVPFAMEK